MAAPRSPHTPSSIPTRTSKGSVRRPSFSTPGPSSPTGVSGFRALRSLLPFGPNKHSTPVSPSVSPNPNGSRFASFSVVRRSINPDRNASLSSSDLPVMVIDQASAEDLPVRKSISLYNEKRSSSQPIPSTVVLSNVPTLNLPIACEDTAPFPSPGPEEPQRNSETRNEKPSVPPPVFTPFRTPSPHPELSTIIEADTSGISKHLPSASPSPSPSPIDPTHSSLPQDEISTLDLSTTHLTSQVLDAIKAQEHSVAGAWLGTEQPGQLAPASELGDVSFNLGALDPDLAALLSPNRMVSSDTNDTIRPSKSSHTSTTPILASPFAPSSTTIDVSGWGHAEVTFSFIICRPLSIIEAGPTVPAICFSPSVPCFVVRRYSTLSTIAFELFSNHFYPRARATNTDCSSNDIDTTIDTPSSDRNRPSLDSAGYRPSSESASWTSLDTNRHRPSLDINRHASGNNTNTVRERPSESSTTWNVKLRRRKRSMSVDEQRTSPSGYSSPYSESRPGSSMSSRPEWLGPRTAKAFKAAGLLGSPDSADGNESLSPPTSGRPRFGFGSTRSSSTVGRSESRAGVVSPGSGRRRGSGSGSYFGSAGSQLMESPTLTMSSRDTPRSVSTAPTSVSGASWGRDGDREEIRELKDKHAVETGALLSALSDSQRTSKVLREENSELRERLARLETEAERTIAVERENQALREFVTELREEAGQLKLQLRLAAPVASSSRYLAPSTTQPFRLAPRGRESPHSADEDVLEDSYTHALASSKNERRRLSSSSSIFPAPPSNMSLLLHEDGANSSDYDERSGASGSLLASPTMVLPRIDGSPNRAHRANQSITSATSFATTSPNASMLGSPRSLLLRPEHEVHLGDMDSLDLGRAGPDEEGWSE
ncbi:hypothetical protein B0H11DRAFT_2241202 [Mycena galericulata]|nr:hypothetical protein B0H11DRAFT_2241202 [Mycena galericulata]